MAAAAVLSPSSSSGLSTPSQVPEQYTTSPLDLTTMTKQPTPLQPSTYLSSKMASVLHTLNYDTSSINTLVTRAESNIVEANNISADNFLDDSESIGEYLGANLLNEKALRERGVYLNSNEPVLVLGYPGSLGFAAQQVREVKENVLDVLRARGIKPVRVYLREIVAEGEDDEDVGLSFSLLNVVNSDIGVNMVSLLDSAFYGEGWKDELVLKEGWNGVDLIWRDEVWTEKRGEEVVEVEQIEEVQEIPAGIVDVVGDDGEEDVAVAADAEVEVEAEIDAAPPTDVAVKQDPIECGTAGAELQRMPDAPVRSFSYKSAHDVPSSEDEEEPEPVQHPALRELLEREAQRPPVQYPTWSRDHDGEAYLDIIKTHSRGQEESGSMSVIAARPEEEKDDFEVVDKP